MPTGRPRSTANRAVIWLRFISSRAALAKVPIIGVNRGSLGFLTTFSAVEARANFAQLLAGAFRVDERAMLQCAAVGSRPELALNDILIKDEKNLLLEGGHIALQAESHPCEFRKVEIKVLKK